MPRHGLLRRFAPRNDDKRVALAMLACPGTTALIPLPVQLLRCLCSRLLRREAAVEGLALGGHLLQKLRRGEARAVLLLKLAAELDKLFRAHEIDIGQRAAGERRETKSEDGSHIGLARIGDDMVLDRTRSLHRLHHEEALLQLLDVERIGIEMLGLQRRQAGPQALLALALFGLVVEALGILAAETALLLDH